MIEDFTRPVHPEADYDSLNTNLFTKVLLPGVEPVRVRVEVSANEVNRASAFLGLVAPTRLQQLSGAVLDVARLVHAAPKGHLLAQLLTHKLKHQGFISAFGLFGLSFDAAERELLEQLVDAITDRVAAR